ncbi:Hypothetical protein DEACI_4267 [Acididesulfobacillus acetoxydans]|nr:hypothetical protein [Acididesulfobacillus acetoxydans]CAA7603444.1 Hypothetical protein DEACI_4267 [Acididesulfobacillus acetoxydans]
MYIRVTSRKNKDNSVVKYVQLAHNVRNPKTGSPQANVLFNFGRLDRLDMESLRRLERSIRRFLGEPLDPVEAPKPEFLSCRPLGGAWFLDQLWRKLGIDSILKRRLKEREYRTEVERALFAMVANRALAPLSKLQLEK